MAAPLRPAALDASAPISDEVLMGRFQAGDRRAFQELVRRHKAPLLQFAMRHMRQPTLAEDMVQDAFVRVVQNAAEFKHEAKFSTWLYTITRNLCIDQLRKLSLRRHPSLDQRAGEEDGPTLGEHLPDGTARANVERAATSGELQLHITRAVERLPAEQREVFLMREVSNLPFKEIAELTGVPENTVKSRMRYALERLQEVLREYEEFAKTLQ